jgi:hypothetical protein
MAGRLTPQQCWVLISRWGNLRNAADEALRRSPELQRLWESQYGGWAGRMGAFQELFWEQVLAVLEIDEPAPAVGEPAELSRSHDETRVSAEIPTELVEKAVQLRAKDRLGRRKLEGAIPGLGEWWARLVLYWYKAGKPAGLWLDEHDRLRWGPAITPVWGREQDREQRRGANAPTPIALRLPRPLKPA